MKLRLTWNIGNFINRLVGFVIYLAKVSLALTAIIPLYISIEYIFKAYLQVSHYKLWSFIVFLVIVFLCLVAYLSESKKHKNRGKRKKK